MILTLIGARPQFIKAAMISAELKRCGIDEKIVHSGQHYDENMSGVFWKELNIPNPDFELQVGSQSHSQQTAEIMQRLEKVILSFKSLPKAITLYGDTNTTLAGALVAAKLQIPIIHIEAGLRSYNLQMPEEINRKVTEHLSDMLFCPTINAAEQLRKEGIVNNVHLSGDVMYDCYLQHKEIAVREYSSKFSNNNKPFILLTIHRPSNTDNVERLTALLQELSKLDMKIIWPVHPRNNTAELEKKIPSNVILTEPFSYFEMLAVLENCSSVITDSGGLQKEAYWAKKPCITLRNETEWIETLEGNWNQLYKGDKSLKDLYNSAEKKEWKPLYGDGHAAKFIVEKMAQKYYC